MNDKELDVLVKNIKTSWFPDGTGSLATVKYGRKEERALPPKEPVTEDDTMFGKITWVDKTSKNIEILQNKVTQLENK